LGGETNTCRTCKENSWKSVIGVIRRWEYDMKDPREIDCENKSEKELSEDHFQWQALLLAVVLNLQVLLPIPAHRWM
jgi:hypothetical protein